MNGEDHLLAIRGKTVLEVIIEPWDVVILKFTDDTFLKIGHLGGWDIANG